MGGVRGGSGASAAVHVVRGTSDVLVPVRTPRPSMMVPSVPATTFTSNPVNSSVQVCKNMVKIEKKI